MARNTLICKVVVATAILFLTSKLTIRSSNPRLRLRANIILARFAFSTSMHQSMSFQLIQSVERLSAAFVRAGMQSFLSVNLAVLGKI